MSRTIKGNGFVMELGFELFGTPDEVRRAYVQGVRRARRALRLARAIRRDKERRANLPAVMWGGW